MVFGLLPILSDTSKVAVEVVLAELWSPTLPVETGRPPSGGKVMEPFAPDTMFPKCMSRILVITIGETTTQVMFA